MIRLDKNYRTQYESLFRQFLEGSTNGHFDEAALPSYVHSNRLMSFLFWKRIETSLSLAGDLKNHSVLDFGCGGGVTFKYLHANNCRITGCENQFPELPREVSRRLSIDSVISDDLCSLDAKFDTIFALDVLEHVDDIAGILERLGFLLSEQGQLIISGPTESRFYQLGRQLAGFSGHYHVRTIYDIEKQCSKTGFYRESVKLLYWPVTLFRISRWKKQPPEGSCL
jgi:2-polyprenyl-3-methyl-5-hydroxy-6-metoxy-1,4-benzoquinol methylase